MYLEFIQFSFPHLVCFHHENIEYFVIQVNGVKNYTTNKIDGVKNYSIEKINDALKTSYGQAVLGQVDSLLNSTEKCIDYYLPEEDGEHLL